MNPAAKRPRGRPPKARTPEVSMPETETLPPEPNYRGIAPDQLASLAEQLDSNPAFGAAFDAADEELFKEWVDCVDPVERERLWIETKALKRLRRQLNRLRMAGRVRRVA